MFFAVVTVAFRPWSLVDALVRRVEGGEADDDDVDVGLASRLALPGESAVGKMNLQPESLEKARSKARRLARLG